MAWTAPRTWALNDLVTPALLNEQLRDNLLALRTPPTCRATQTTATSLANATYTAVTFNAEAWDTDAIHSTTTNTERLNPSTAGKYLVVANVGLSGAANLTLAARLFKNTTAIAYQAQTTTPSVSPDGIVIQTIIDMNGTTDYLTVEVYQNSGAARNTNTGITFFSCVWVAP